jgi:hypothetical protein
MGSSSQGIDFCTYSLQNGTATFWNTEVPHLDKHWIAGVLVGLELLAVTVEEDGLGPQDQHNVVGIRSCAQRVREILVEW